MSLSLTCPFRLIVDTIAEINEQLNMHIYRVVFFNWSALKMTKCQITCKSLQKSSKCQIFQWVWHLVIFRADQLKKPPCIFIAEKVKKETREYQEDTYCIFCLYTTFCIGCILYFVYLAYFVYLPCMIFFGWAWD